MPGEPVPAKVGAYKSLFFFGYREGIILAIGGLPTALCLVFSWLPESLTFVRIGIAILLGGLTVLWMFGRDPNSGETPEQLLLKWLDHNATPKILMRGFDKNADRDSQKVKQAYPVRAAPIQRAQTGAFAFQPIDLTTLAFVQLFSYAMLGALIAWLYFGGVQQIIRLLNLSSLK